MAIFTKQGRGSTRPAGCSTGRCRPTTSSGDSAVPAKRATTAMPSSATISSPIAGSSSCRSSRAARRVRTSPCGVATGGARRARQPAGPPGQTRICRRALFEPPPAPPDAAQAGRRRTAGPEAAAAAGRRTRCAMPSASAPTRSGRTIATSSCGRSFPTIRGPRSGPTATTCRRAPATSVDPEACLRGRSRADARGRAGERAVRHHRRRQLPQQRRHRRHDAAPAGAPNIMMAAGGTQLKQHLRRRRDLRLEVPRGLERSRAKTRGHGTREDRGGAVSLPLRRPAHQLRAAARHRPPARRAGRQDHGAARVPPHRRDRESIVAVHSVNTSAGGGGVRWYEFRIDRDRRVLALPAGHLRPGQRLPLDGESGDGPSRQHRHRLLVRRRAALRGPALRRRAAPAIRSGS